MNPLDYARLATRLLSERPRLGAPDALGDRASAVAQIERALRARARRVVIGRMALVTSAAAMILLVALAVRPSLVGFLTHGRPSARPGQLVADIRIVEGGVGTLIDAHGAHPFSTATKLAPGDRVSLPARSQAAVVLSEGTRLGLGDRADVEISALDAVRRFVLRSGRLRADVAKLQPGQRFLIATDDAEIEVHGTSFEVVATPGVTCGGARTRVQVFEGVVAVRHAGEEIRLPAGTTWPAGCEQAPHPAAAEMAPPPSPSPLRPTVVAHRPNKTTASAAPAPQPAVEAPSSTLREQNDLFGAALAAHRRGDETRAATLLDELLARFPSGSLAERARGQRRALGDTNGGP